MSGCDGSVCEAASSQQQQQQSCSHNGSERADDSSRTARGEEDEGEMELRQLVTRVLENNGVLSRLRAQLRASVFLALDDCDASVALTTDGRPLRRRSTPVDSCCAALVRDWLAARRLDYTLSVLEAELGSGDESGAVQNDVAPFMTSGRQSPLQQSTSPDTLDGRSTADASQLASLLGLPVEPERRVNEEHGQQREQEGGDGERTPVLECLVRHQLSNCSAAPTVSIAEAVAADAGTAMTALPPLKPRRLIPPISDGRSVAGITLRQERVVDTTTTITAASDTTALSTGFDRLLERGDQQAVDTQTPSPSPSSPSPVSLGAASLDDEDSFFDSLPQVKLTPQSVETSRENQTFVVRSLSPDNSGQAACENPSVDTASSSSKHSPHSQRQEIGDRGDVPIVAAIKANNDDDHTDSSIAEELEDVGDDSHSLSEVHPLSDLSVHQLDVASV